MKPFFCDDVDLDGRVPTRVVNLSSVNLCDRHDGSGLRSFFTDVFDYLSKGVRFCQ